MKSDSNYVSAFYFNKPFFIFFICIQLSLFTMNNSLGQDNLRKAEKSFRDWSVFVSKEDPKMCFIASQSIKGEAFRNNQKLSSVNREKGTLYIMREHSMRGIHYRLGQKRFSKLITRKR